VPALLESPVSPLLPAAPLSSTRDWAPSRTSSELPAIEVTPPDGLAPPPDYAGDAALDAVHLAWAGPTEPGQPLYYRVQGPRLLIEYDNTQRHANHAHSVWRDPAADFGYDVLGAHLAEHHLR